MMGKHYNKENRRKNMRLQGYDYSRAGLYFLTVVVQNRLHLFGEIHRGGPAVPSKLFLNDAGSMVEKWYHEIENKFPDKRCHVFWNPADFILWDFLYLYQTIPIREKKQNRRWFLEELSVEVI
ncbi:MAG: hypothetical protein K9H84_05330 [Bacteroidales bacterium]|nr:hypothetical protein [Bacteroidales bacterium]